MRRFRRLFSLVLVLVLITALFSGCNQATSARDCITRFQQAMNQNDYHTAFLYVNNYDGFGFNDANTEKIIDAVASSLQMDVISENGGGTTTAVTVRITTIDLRELYCQAAQTVVPQFYSSAVGGSSLASAELSNMLVNEVVNLASRPDAVKVSTECIVYVSNNDGKWNINLDSATYSAITGYLNEANDLVSGGQIMLGTDYSVSATTKPADVITTQPQPETVIEGLEDLNTEE